MNRLTRARLAGAGALSLMVAAVVVACAGSPDTSAVTNIYISPNAFTDFAGGAPPPPATVPNAGVIGFIALKCGTLDCHGSIGRPFRIFSQFGLRLVDEAGDIPGGAPTTEAEIYADYISAISVQPELTSKVFYGLLDPHTLLLLRKPRGLERHKGGTVLGGANDPGDICLTSWLQDGLQDQNGKPLTIDNTNCNLAAQLP
jgi:hypothetical protein